jgi:hypothetical protein
MRKASACMAFGGWVCRRPSCGRASATFSESNSQLVISVELPQPVQIDDDVEALADRQFGTGREVIT